MIPNPLHPAVVHFPLVLAVLLPVVALAGLWMIRRGSQARRAWALPLAVAAALTLSAWVAVQTGESQEERVERVVADQPLDAHEESAELFIWAAGTVLVIVAAGLLPGVAGKSARVLGVLGAIVLVASAVRVGHSGGQLVYVHGAASAYVQTTTNTAGGTVAPDEHDDGR